MLTELYMHCSSGNILLLSNLPSFACHHLQLIYVRAVCIQVNHLNNVRLLTFVDVVMPRELVSSQFAVFHIFSLC
jgi:hypothetical protein